VVTVLVPTYRRPRDLLRCLEAVSRQTRTADEVIVIVREDDHETREALTGADQHALRLRTVTVAEPGAVQALNAGLRGATGDIVAITDDDAAPRPDWLARIEAYFAADGHVGGVGGRDWVHYGDRVENGARRIVGKVQWFGRTIGNHHLGVGRPREVDVLKGVNCAYRRTAIWHVGFDERLLGTGAQLYWELSLGLQLRRAGWKLVYDPEVAVDHYPAPRFDEDQRRSFRATTFGDMVHNETLVLLEHLSPMRRFVFGFWALFVGTRSAPGLLQWLRLSLYEGRLASTKLRAALRGRADGLKTWRRYDA
jgi:cellulose synthase/poly-beta-1,6-N-acetylglucosamine synthase-like glycosyltransferase